MGKREIEIKFRADTKSVETAVGQLKGELKDINREYRLQNETLKGTGTAYQQLEAKQNMYTKSLRAQKQIVKEYQDHLNNVKNMDIDPKNIAKIQTRYDNAKKSMQYFQNAVDDTKIKMIELAYREEGAIKASERNHMTIYKKRKELANLNVESLKTADQQKNLASQYDILRAKMGDNVFKSHKLALEQSYLSGAIVNTKKEQAILNAQIATATDLYGKNSEKVLQLKSRLQETALNLANMETRYRTITDGLRNFGDRAVTVGQGMSRVGSTLTRGVTMPLLLAGGAIAKETSDFDTGMSKVKRTVDEYRDSTGKVVISHEDIAKSIRKMSTELPIAQKELADLVSIGGQLGIKTPDLMKFAETITKISTTSDMSQDFAADNLAKFANITGMATDKFDRLGSSIVLVGNSLATNESSVVGMSMRLAAAGKQVGLTENQIVGLAGALSSLGLQEESGGTAFSKLLLNMKVASDTSRTGLKDLEVQVGNTKMKYSDLLKVYDQGSDAIQVLAEQTGAYREDIEALVTSVDKGQANMHKFAKVANMTEEAFQNLIEKNPQEALTKFLQGLGDTERNGKSAAAVLEEMGITEVRLRDAILRTSGASDLLNQSFALGKKGWEENITLNEKSAKAYETFSNKLKLFKNKLIDIALDVGPAILDFLTNAADSAKPFIDKIKELTTAFSNMDKEGRDKIIKLVGALALLGPALKIGGGTLSMIGNAAKGIANLRDAFGAGKIAKQALDVGKGLSSIGNAAPALGKLSGAKSIFGSLISKAGEFTGAVGGSAEAFGGLISKAAPLAIVLGGAFSIARGIVKENTQSALEAMEMTEYGASETAKKVYSAFYELNTKLGGLTFQRFSAKSVITQEDVEQVKALTGQMYDGLRQQIETKGQEAAKVYGNLMSGASADQKRKWQDDLDQYNNTLNVRAEKLQAHEKQITDIYQRAAEEKRALTQNEVNTINQIRESAQQIAIVSAAQSEQDLIVLKQRSKDVKTQMARDEVQQIIQESARQRDAVINAANAEYNEAIKFANMKRAEGTAQAQQEADEIIRAAKYKRDKTVNEAKGLHDGVVAEAQKQYGDVMGWVNKETGESLSAWQRFKQGVSGCIDNIIGFVKRLNATPLTDKMARYQVIFSTTGSGGGSRPSPGNRPSMASPYASGTSYARGGLALVGENGPELVHLPRGSRVDTATRTAESIRRGAVYQQGRSYNSMVSITMDNVSIRDERDIKQLAAEIDRLQRRKVAW